MGGFGEHPFHFCCLAFLERVALASTHSIFVVWLFWNGWLLGEPVPFLLFCGFGMGGLWESPFHFCCFVVLEWVDRETDPFQNRNFRRLERVIEKLTHSKIANSPKGNAPQIIQAIDQMASGSRPFSYNSSFTLSTSKIFLLMHMMITASRLSLE